MKKSVIILAIATIMLLQASRIFAQNAVSTGGTFELKQSVVANGGGAISGGAFTLENTIGQPLAGTLSQNGGLSLLSGFQTGVPLTQTGSLVISGQVTNSGNAMTGVTVVLTGGATMTAVTNVTGNYSFAGLASGTNYTVTPFFSNFAFNQQSLNFNNLTANQTANFAAAPCTFVLNSDGTNASSTGSNGTVSLTTSTAGCTWTAASNDNWISVMGTGHGTGSGTISFVVSPNNGAQRTGTIVIAGQNLIVTQSGVSGFTVSGTISYGTTAVNQPKFVSGVTLATTGSAQLSVVSDNSGFYQLSGLAAGGNYTVTPSKTGNVNGISAFDATLVLRCVAAGNNCTLTDNQKLAADASADNLVSAFDATQILRFVAANGANANTGQTGNWKFSPAPRSYNSVSSSFSTENYTAVLIGEVNGDWTAPGNLNSLAALNEAEQETESLAVSSGISESDAITEKADDGIQTETSKQSEDAEVEISLPADVVGVQGSSVLIPVRLDNQSGKRISAYSFAVRFDSKVLQPETNPAVTAETLSANGFTIVSDKNTPGRIGIAASNPNDAMTASGTLLYLRFKVIGASSDSSAIRFQTTAPDKATFEGNSGSFVASSKNGKLTVSTAPTVDFVSVRGRVLTAEGRGIRNVLVSLTDEQGNTKTVLTGASGYYSFADIKRGATYTITVSAKKYGFNHSSQSRLIDGETNDVNFTANPQP
jgi:hypothetical protein